MNNWKETELSNIIEIINGYAFKSQDFKDHGIPIIKIKNVKPQEIKLNELSYVDKETIIGKEKWKINKGDILITMSGNRSDGSPDSWVGKVAEFNKDGVYYLNQRLSILKPIVDYVNSTFLAYLLSSWDYQLELISLSNSSGGQANISPQIVKQLKVTLPSKVEQENIAEVLTSLDKKRDLLHRNNKTLEELAETLFKQWFDINNEDVSKHGYLGDYFKDTIGGEWGKDKEDIDHNIEVKCIRGTDIGNLYNGIPKPPIRYIKESKYEKCKLLDGDIIIEISGGTEDQSTGRCHYFNNNLIELLGGKVVFSNFCRLLRPKLNDYTYFLHVYLNLIYQRGDFFNLENGTSGIKNLDLKSFLYQEKFFLPTDMDIIRFNKIVTPFFNKLTKNLNQIQQLETLRDTLLPKLMSGLVRVEN